MPSSRRAMSLHAYRSIASARAASPIATRRGSSARSAVIASTSAEGSSGGTVTERLRRRHLAVAGDVRRDDGKGAREGPRQHHAEALAAERRRDQRLRPREQARQLLLRQEAEDVDARVRDPQPGEEQPDGEWIGAADLEPSARSRVDRGPGAQEDLEPLAGLLPAGEGDRVLTSRRDRRRRG